MICNEVSISILNGKTKEVKEVMVNTINGEFEYSGFTEEDGLTISYNQLNLSFWKRVKFILTGRL